MKKEKQRGDTKEKEETRTKEQRNKESKGETERQGKEIKNRKTGGSKRATKIVRIKAAPKEGPKELKE